MRPRNEQIEKGILKVLKDHPNGLSIADIERISKIPYSNIHYYLVRKDILKEKVRKEDFYNSEKRVLVTIWKLKKNQ